MNDSSVEPLSEEHSDTFGWGLERFITEAQTLARFQHANIVRVYSVFEANGTAYLVMEFEDGESLESMIDAGSTGSGAELLALFAPLLLRLLKWRQVRGGPHVVRECSVGATNRREAKQIPERGTILAVVENLALESGPRMNGFSDRRDGLR